MMAAIYYSAILIIRKEEDTVQVPAGGVRVCVHYGTVYYGTVNYGTVNYGTVCMCMCDKCSSLSGLRPQAAQGRGGHHEHGGGQGVSIFILK